MFFLFIGLERVLYVGVYLLAVISVPSILSAPHTAPSRTMGEPRWWWNPCSDDSGIPGDSSDNSEEPVVNFSSLLLATDMALGQAETFKDEYVSKLLIWEIAMELYYKFCDKTYYHRLFYRQ